MSSRQRVFNAFVAAVCLAPLLLTIAALVQYTAASHQAEREFQRQQAAYHREMTQRIKAYKKTLAERP